MEVVGGQLSVAGCFTTDNPLLTTDNTMEFHHPNFAFH